MVIELRRWTDTDAESLLRAMTTSDDLSTQTGGAVLTTISQAREFIAGILAPRTDTAINLAISENGRAVGNVGVSSIEHVHGTGWTYYWVAREARGRGLATAALASIAVLAFRELDLFRLELGHRVINLASCTVASRAGFPVEGVERSKLRYGGKRFDVETHSRLRIDPDPGIRLIPIR